MDRTRGIINTGSLAAPPSDFRLESQLAPHLVSGRLPQTQFSRSVKRFSSVSSVRSTQSSRRSIAPSLLISFISVFMYPSYPVESHHRLPVLAKFISNRRPLNNLSILPSHTTLNPSCQILSNLVKLKPSACLCVVPLHLRIICCLVNTQELT